MMVTGLKKSGSLGTQFSDMRFVQNFTPPDFQAKNITLSISPNFKSDKTHKKMSENGEIYTAGKKFTLPPAVTAWTNSTSATTMTANMTNMVINYLQVHIPQNIHFLSMNTYLG